MGKQRKEDPPPPGAPAWTATFGDLMNLLLCFFVLLFSMSTIDAEAFEQLAASFTNTISILTGGATAIGEGVLISSGVSQLNELDDYINSTGRTAEDNPDAEEYDAEESAEQLMDKVEQMQIEASEALAEQIAEAVAEEALAGKVDIEFTSQYVQLTMNGAILFDSGQATLGKEVLPTMEKIGGILETYAQHTVEIEGHTDNVPMHSAKYANNNELSAARALSVFDYLMENTTLDPAKVKTSGRGEYVPVADNSTPEGRAKNRRVEIRIYHELSDY